MRVHLERTLALASLLALACNGNGLEPLLDLPRDLSVSEAALVDADNRFAFKLFREVNAQDTTEGNVFISPLSVGMALGMAYNGAAGATREAMRETLELQGLTLEQVNAAYRSLIDLLRGLDAGVEFTIANSVWHDLDYVPLPAFADATSTYFDATVQGLDFESPSAVATINAWVNDATRGKIAEIIDEIPDSVIAYLINAIYFKGDWTTQFDKGRTRKQAFYRPDGSTVQVDMMSYAAEAPIRFAWVDGWEIVDLPYAREAYGMTIALPPEDANIHDVAEAITAAQWAAWIASLNETDRYVSMPKYTLEWDGELKSVLAALGMEEAFCGHPAVDFSSMFAAWACVTRVLHKTYINVDEEGTEAAAVTAVEMGFTSAPAVTVVDRPFLFAIRERFSGTILFMGKIVDPTAD